VLISVRDFIMVGKTPFVLNFASDSGKLHWDRIKFSKQLSVIMAWEQHRLLVFSIQTWRKFG
jgi:hypothetical protein